MKYNKEIRDYEIETLRSNNNTLDAHNKSLRQKLSEHRQFIVHKGLIDEYVAWQVANRMTSTGEAW